MLVMAAMRTILMTLVAMTVTMRVAPRLQSARVHVATCSTHCHCASSWSSTSVLCYLAPAVGAQAHTQCAPVILKEGRDSSRAATVAAKCGQPVVGQRCLRQTQMPLSAPRQTRCQRGQQAKHGVKGQARARPLAQRVKLDAPACGRVSRGSSG